MFYFVGSEVWIECKQSGATTKQPSPKKYSEDSTRMKKSKSGTINDMVCSKEKQGETRMNQK